MTETDVLHHAALAEPQPSVRGRVVLVSGGGRGLGSALASALADAGARVVVVARSEAEINAVARGIAVKGGDAVAFAADVSSIDAVRRLRSEIHSAYGQVDVLVNNAAVIAPIAAITDVDPAEWSRNVLTNVVGAFNCLQVFLPDMLRRGRGRVVGISSSMSERVAARLSAYSASKAAFEHLHRVAAQECVDVPNVKVNRVWPGPLDTGMQHELMASMPPEAAEMTRTVMQDPHAVAARVLPLCADELELHDTRLDLFAPIQERLALSGTTRAVDASPDARPSDAV